MLTLESYIPPVAIACLIVITIHLLSRRTRGQRFPGPPPLPVIGNVHQFPKGEQFKAWAAWGKMYGPVIELRAFSQKIIIINSHKAATDLLSERGHIYSGRPMSPMAGGECGWNETLTMMDPGEKFRRVRAFLRVLEGDTMEKFKAHVESEAHKFIIRLYGDPENFVDHLRITAGAVSFLISHGYVLDPRPNSDPFLSLARQVINEASMTMEPGKWWIDMLPILKYVPYWFPGAKFKRVARACRENLERIVREPHEWAKKEIAAGQGLDSTTSFVLESMGEEGTEEDEKLIKYGTFVIFAGGADTIVSASTTLFLALSRSPQIVLLAREELDEVVGQDRIPVWNDRPKLPYIEAIMTEILRFIPPAPSGIPHKATQDDIYEGYPVEKGTLVFFNIWGMTHDENIFRNPFEFSPERFLRAREGGSGKSKWTYVGSQPDPRMIIFGYGRRFCPGRDLALMELWHLTALTIHLFDVIPRENNPKPIGEHKVVTETLSHPAQFDCIVKPRSDKAEQLIHGMELSEEAPTSI